MAEQKQNEGKKIAHDNKGNSRETRLFILLTSQFDWEDDSSGFR